MILHGLCPAALIRRPRFFLRHSSLTYMALPRGHYQCPCFLFLRIKNKKNRLVRRLKMYFLGLIDFNVI